MVVKTSTRPKRASRAAKPRAKAAPCTPKKSGKKKNELDEFKDAAVAGRTAVKKGLQELRIFGGQAKAKGQAIKRTRSQKQSLARMLLKEPVPVANFARRAIKKGTKAGAAIRQGRILNNNGILNDNGTKIKAG